MQSPIMPLPSDAASLRREIADLIGVREKHQVGLGLRDGLRERDGEAVGRVLFEQVVLDEEDFGELVGGEFVGEGAHALADNCGGEAALRLRGDLLRGGQRFKADWIPLAVALLGDDEDIHDWSEWGAAKRLATSL